MPFSPRQLFESGNMEREHIIPRSLASDSLESLVITWKVNDMKGQRTCI
ncbi:MAG: HNH endonuclease domain-containing protein [Bacilli bacterium]